jgi:hypothetical protein
MNEFVREKNTIFFYWLTTDDPPSLGKPSFGEAS